jgi:hypothetical protein
MAHASTDTLAIRVMDRTDLDQAIDWAAAEGWNPGLKDAECFQAADPAGFLRGCLDGQPIGSISVVRYSSTFGFLGFYIVRRISADMGSAIASGRPAWTTWRTARSASMVSSGMPRRL